MLQMLFFTDIDITYSFFYFHMFRYRREDIYPWNKPCASGTDSLLTMAERGPCPRNAPVFGSRNFASNDALKVSEMLQEPTVCEFVISVIFSSPGAWWETERAFGKKNGIFYVYQTSSLIVDELSSSTINDLT